MNATLFYQSLKIQSRIIGALLLREILTRYGRHNIGFMWVFIEPMLFTTGVLILWLSWRSHSIILPLVPFTVSGYATILMWRNIINRCGNAVEPNRSLMHHRNVRVIDLFAARLILEASGASMSFLFLSILFNAIGFMDAPDDILKMIIAWLLLGWFCFSIGMIIGSLSMLSESVDRVWHVLSYLFLPISGAFFMVDWLPSSAQKLVLWIPIVNCTELLREGIFGISVRAHYSIPYVIVSCIVAMLPALYLNRYVSNKVEGD